MKTFDNVIYEKRIMCTVLSQALALVKYRIITQSQSGSK